MVLLNREPDELALWLKQYHVETLALLANHDAAPIPYQLCHPVARNSLYDLGLIETYGIPGFWSITKEGSALLDRARYFESNPPPRKNPQFPWEPVGEARELLSQSYAKIDALLPGERLFGAEVLASHMDFLSGRPRHHKFIYFAYPLGFPLKHIAWAVRQDRPLWTDGMISITRNKRLGMPAMRKRARRVAPGQIEREELTLKLLNSGMQQWEIKEYFAFQTGEPIL